jgi:hypothetical protein
MKIVLVVALVAMAVSFAAQSAGAALSSRASAVAFREVETQNAAPSTVSRTESSLNREQAVRKAHEYLQFEAFSFKGLVTQLKYEGFSTADATYGASHSGANWFKEAAAKAKEYLKIEAFSRSGMVTQLEYDGFTPAQALYGARAAGL